MTRGRGGPTQNTVTWHEGGSAVRSSAFVSGSWLQICSRQKQGASGYKPPVHAGVCRAIRNDPNQLVLQHSLARLLLKLGQVRAATILLDKCLEVHKAREQAGGSTNLEALALDVDT